MQAVSPNPDKSIVTLRTAASTTTLTTGQTRSSIDSPTATVRHTRSSVDSPNISPCYQSSFSEYEQKPKLSIATSTFTWKSVLHTLLGGVQFGLCALILFFWLLWVGNELDKYTRYEVDWQIDIRSTSLNASKSVVISKNQYCSHMIRTILLTESAAAAGRAMLHCIYMTEPHLASPLGYNMFAVYDIEQQTGQIFHTEENVPKNIELLKKIYEDHPELTKTGLYSIGVNNFAYFLSKVAIETKATEAMSILKKKTADYSQMPASKSLVLALRRQRWSISKQSSFSNYMSLGTTLETGHYINQSLLMKTLTDDMKECLADGDKCDAVMDRFKQDTINLYAESTVLGNLFDTHDTMPKGCSSQWTATSFPRKNWVIAPKEKITQNTLKNLSALMNADSTLHNFADMLTLVDGVHSEFSQRKKSTQKTATSTGFLIIKDGKLSMGASGYDSEFGAKVAVNGMIYNNALMSYAPNEENYNGFRFLPVLHHQITDDGKRKFSATLILSRDYSDSLQYLANFASELEMTPYGTAIRMPFMKRVPNKASDEDDVRRFVFSSNAASNHVNLFKKLNPKDLYSQDEYAKFGIDLMGAEELAQYGYGAHIIDHTQRTHLILGE